LQREAMKDPVQMLRTQYTATHCNTLQHTAAHCSTLQHTAAHCSTLQHTAAHCSTHCNIHCNTYCNSTATRTATQTLRLQMCIYLCSIERQRCIACLKLQDFSRKKPITYRALLRKMTYNKGSCSGVAHANVHAFMQYICVCSAEW